MYADVGPLTHLYLFGVIDFIIGVIVGLNIESREIRLSDSSVPIPRRPLLDPYHVVGNS